MPSQRCPLTYEVLSQNDNSEASRERGYGAYCAQGLKTLSRNLKALKLFPYTREEQIDFAKRMAGKLSIQGVQPKLSAVLDVRQESFVLTERGGTYILKPQNLLWAHLPENEDLVMDLAAMFRISVPLHGLIYAQDMSLSYFIRRFDRPSLRNPIQKKVAVEDFAQLSGKNRLVKYESSMEQVAKVIEKFTTFPMIEKQKFFRMSLFNFIVGNEDMHLKNFSLIQNGKIVELSPAYDLLSTTVALQGQASEEIALPLNGRKNRLTYQDWILYFAYERLHLNSNFIQGLFNELRQIQQKWNAHITHSFLPEPQKNALKSLIQERLSIVNIAQ